MIHLKKKRRDCVWISFSLHLYFEHHSRQNTQRLYCVWWKGVRGGVHTSLLSRKLAKAEEREPTGLGLLSNILLE